MRRVPSRDLPNRLRALDRAARAARGRLADDVVGPAEDVVARAGERLQLSSHHTVVALAGATGGGKSSLFNALAGLELARVGVRRPTTGEALACVWGADGAGPLLAWLGIPARHQLARESELDPGAGAQLDGLVLLDLPDHDSTTLSHRLEVDRLVQLVDVFVWVVDPQKYADAVLHDRYLKPLRGHADVTIAVLNQADRLPPDEVETCLRDLRRLLEADGLADATVLAVSARTGAGVGELRGVLHDAVRRRRAAEDRLSADVERAATGLLAAAGDARVAGVSGRVRESLVDALAEAAGVPAVVTAVERAGRQQAAAATGWPLTRWLGRLRPDPLRRLRLDRSTTDPALVRSSLPEPTPVQQARVDAAVRQLVESSTTGADRAEAAAVRDVAVASADRLPDRLDQAVVGVDLGAARRPRWWALAGWVQWLALGVTAVGLGWLLLLWALVWVRVPEPPTPDWHGWPVPTLLLLGGLGVSLVVAVVSRLLAGVGARRRALVARRRLRAAVAAVADDDVVAPVTAELAGWRDVREQALAARG